MDKKYHRLSKEERYYIYKQKAIMPVDKIAEMLGRHRSAIYRELSRNKDEHGMYTAGGATRKMLERRGKRYKPFAKITLEIRQYIIDKLKLKWSPEQIAGRLTKQRITKISTKLIYNYIRNDKLNGGTLYKLLPHKGKKYKYSRTRKSTIQNRVDISQRPKIVETKSRIGDWEGDTVIGVKNGSKHCLGTFVDRKSKFTIMLHLKDKTAAGLQDALENCFMNCTLPFETITFDNGTEFAYHQEITANINCPIYFARPYKSCDRGLNEHTNGQIRKFFPKKTDFSQIDTADIITVQNLLNERPRKALNFLTPNEVMNKHLNSMNKKIMSHWT